MKKRDYGTCSSDNCPISYQMLTYLICTINGSIVLARGFDMLSKLLRRRRIDPMSNHPVGELERAILAAHQLISIAKFGNHQSAPFPPNLATENS